MKNHLTAISIILLFAYVHFVIGCSYYKVTHADSIEPVADQIRNNSKYFIVHQGANAWHLAKIVLDNETEVVTGTLEPLPKNHLQYLKTKPEGPNRIRTKDRPSIHRFSPENDPTYEVHFYISEYLENENQQVTIPLSSITKIEIYDKDSRANTASTILTAVGVTAGFAVIIGVIVALTKSSCPFVYVWDGTSYRFTGEMFGGAIYSSLERNDFMPLPGFTPSNGVYQLKISNELMERQYTNFAELIVVEHPDTATVLLDKDGKVIPLLNITAPVRAVSESHLDYSTSVASRDKTAYAFDAENTLSKEFSSLTLTFKKPLHAGTGHLVINAKNSYWLDYVYGKFNEQFGTYFNTFSQAQKKRPADKINEWALEQGIPLSVYVMGKNGWEFADYFHVTGPLASRDMVMPIDLSNVKDEEVCIKLECGFMFWELDYAGMDFSENIPVTISHVSANSAIDEKGFDVSSLLAATDTAYLVQPEVGNEVVLTYPMVPPGKNTRQTVFLHSRGYYEYIREYTHLPNFITLSTFKKKEAFAKFSKEEYFEFIKKPCLFDSSITSTHGK